MTSAIPFSTVLMQIPECTNAQAVPGDLHNMVGKAFLTALLLTGSAQRAEAAILEGRGAMDLDQLSEEVLFRRTVDAATAPQSDLLEEPSEELERASATLPFELRRVLHLPLALRQCFVLRFLIGLPREVCAQLLRLEVRQVDVRARTALLELPTIRWKSQGAACNELVA
jgi:hypothetical protein